MVGMIASINKELLDKWRKAAKRHEAVNVTRDVSSMVLKRKGQVVKRIALLLGNGLIASNGQFWANQRRKSVTAKPAVPRHRADQQHSCLSSSSHELSRLREGTA